MSDTVKKVLGWVVGITVLLLFVAFLLPKLLKKALGGITDLFKTEEDKKQESQQDAQNKALEEWATKQSKVYGKDYKTIADQCETALEGWGYNWNKLNSILRENKLSVPELVLVYTNFGRRKWASWNKWGDLTLIEIFIYELNDEHYKTMKAYWSSTPLAGKFTR